MISIGGIVEIAPLFYLRSTIEKVEGVRPYTPLELAGRAIYVREGCYKLPQPDDPPAARRDRALRPLQPGGREHVRQALPVGLEADGARSRPRRRQVLGQWQHQHLNAPKSLVPQSIMPGYPFLARTELEFADIASHMKANRIGGVPYTDEMIANAVEDVKAQVNPDHPQADAFQKRYPKAVARNFDGDARRITEADALIAYLQMLGTLVDFKLYDGKANLR